MAVSRLQLAKVRACTTLTSLPWARGSPGDGSHVSAIRVRLHPLPYIPPCRWIPGAHNGESTQRAEESGGVGEGGKKEAEEGEEGRVVGARKKKYAERKGNEPCLVHPLWGSDRYSSGARG